MTSASPQDGALRYIDAAAVRRGLDSVRLYQGLSLAMPIRHGAGLTAPMRQPPQHFLRRDGGDYFTGARSEVEGFGFSDDVIMLATHGTTHIDALCHVFCDGKMFGDVSADTISSNGAAALGVETIPPIVTRALALDVVPASRPWLDPGEAVTVDMLDAALASASLRPEAGDALLVRTGSVEAFDAGERHQRSWPGLATECIEWIRHHRFSVIGADNVAVEMVPSGIAGSALPLHTSLMREDGVLFLELLDLRSLRHRSVAGMLTINPLKIVGGTASPVAPMLML